MLCYVISYYIIIYYGMLYHKLLYYVVCHMIVRGVLQMIPTRTEPGKQTTAMSHI